MDFIVNTVLFAFGLLGVVVALDVLCAAVAFVFKRDYSGVFIGIYFMR